MSVMNSVREVLEKLTKNEVSLAEAEKMLKLLAIDELGCLAKLDGNRELRKAFRRLFWLKEKTQRMWPTFQR